MFKSKGIHCISRFEYLNIFKYETVKEKIIPAQQIK